MIGTADQDTFINQMKWAVVTTLRRDGSPANSVIFYARDGDALIFSTTRDRLKGRTLTRDPRIALTVLDEGPPYRFVTIEGLAEIIEDDIVPGHVAINKVMRGEAAFEPPPGFEQRLRDQGRIIVRVMADRVSGVVNR